MDTNANNAYYIDFKSVDLIDIKCPSHIISVININVKYQNLT